MAASADDAVINANDIKALLPHDLNTCFKVNQILVMVLKAYPKILQIFLSYTFDFLAIAY